MIVAGTAMQESSKWNAHNWNAIEITIKIHKIHKDNYSTSNCHNLKNNFTKNWFFSQYEFEKFYLRNSFAYEKYWFLVNEVLIIVPLEFYSSYKIPFIPFVAAHLPLFEALPSRGSLPPQLRFFL